MFNFTAIGLAYDGIGVAILGYAFFSTQASSIFLSTRTFWGGNDEKMAAGLRSRTDGIVGTILLLIGFGLQLLGAIGFSSVAVTRWLWITLGVYTLLYLAFLRKWFVRIQQENVEKFETEWREGRNEH